MVAEPRKRPDAAHWSFARNWTKGSEDRKEPGRDSECLLGTAFPKRQCILILMCSHSWHYRDLVHPNVSYNRDNGRLEQFDSYIVGVKRKPGS